MAVIMDGKETARKIRENLKGKVDDLKAKNIFPKLAVIMVGDDGASKIYVRNKSKACEEVGIEYEEFLLGDETTQEELLNLINELNNRQDINGILLQSPIPKHLNINEAFRTILPEKDVDGFHPQSAGALMIGSKGFLPCTPAGIVELIKRTGVEISGKECVVIGRSNIVGKPMAMIMLKENATVTIAHSRTKDLKEVTKRADILIVAIGKPKFITADYVKEGAVVIDVGIHRNEDNKLCGDVDFDSVSEKTYAITPVPGGVGPMTVTMLLANCVRSAKLFR